MYLTIENKTGIEQTIDPELIFLLDDKNNKYSVEMFAHGVTPNPYRVREHTLKAGNSKKYLLGFDPSFPEGSKVRILIVDKIYDLSYRL